MWVVPQGVVASLEDATEDFKFLLGELSAGTSTRIASQAGGATISPRVGHHYWPRPALLMLPHSVGRISLDRRPPSREGVNISGRSLTTCCRRISHSFLLFVLAAPINVFFGQIVVS